jgi:hypothetical protein
VATCAYRPGSQRHAVCGVPCRAKLLD